MRTSNEDKRKTRKKRDSVRLECDADKMEEKSLRYFRKRYITTTTEHQHRSTRSGIGMPTSVVDCDKA